MGIESANSFSQSPKDPLKGTDVKPKEFFLHVASPKGISGRLEIPTEAANNEEFIESLDKRKGVFSIENKAAGEWLQNVHSYIDYRSLLRLYGQGFITFENGLPTLNASAFKGKLVRDFLPMPFLSSMQELHECLLRNGVSGVPGAKEFQSINEVPHSGGIQKGTIKYPIKLPDSFGDLLHGEAGENSYGGKVREEHWYDPLTLPDGTTTNAFEVMLAQCMAEAGVIRKKDGLYFTKGKYSEEPATITKILRSRHGYIAHGFSFPERKSIIEVFSYYLPNLKKSGLIQEIDFRVNKQGEEVNYMRFVPKSQSDVSLKSGIATSKYYFGRDKYIHNKKEIPPGTAAMVLDSSTGGIFEKENGVMVLKYTFPLITEDELQKEKERVAEKFGVKPEELTPSQITMNARKSLAAEQIREYSATDYISEYRDEGRRDYGKRIESLANTEATINAINGIFIKADLNQLSVSWGKKIRLAEALGRIQKDKVVDFAKRYGLPGLQVLLASEADKGWPEEVLSFADKPENADLFAAYSSLLTDEDEFRSLIDASTVRNGEAREHLADLRRASLEDVIAGIRRVVRGEAPLADVVAKSREGVLGKLSLVKALKKERLLNSLEDIKGAQLEMLDPREISDDETKQAMRMLYEEHYAAKPRLQKKLLEAFDKNIQDTSGKVRFAVLRHNGKVKGFYHLKETAPHHYEFGSFNVEYQGYKLGETMLEESLGMEAKESVIEADCDSTAPIAAFYIEHGFIGTDSFDYEGAPSLHIVRNDSLHGQTFKTAAYDLVKVQSLATVGETRKHERGNIVVVAVKAANLQKMPLELLKESEANRYALTRYFFHKTAKENVVYAVFEKVSAVDLKTYKGNPQMETEKTAA